MVTGVLGVAIIAAAGLSYATLSGRFNPRDEGVTSLVWALLEGMLVAVLVGLASALVAQSQPSSSRPVLAAILGWTAATVANIAGAIFGQSGPSATANGTLVPSLVIILLLWTGFGGMVFAVLGGVLGKGLRALAKNSAT
jgi:peptidoglycan/LPS O-acetylase OafA/YrhL